VPSHSIAQQHFFNGAQSGSRGTGSNSLSNRNASSAAGGSANRGNWHTFTPPASHSTGSTGGTSAAGRTYSAQGNASNSRPSLNMSHPIVAPRSSSSYGGGNSASRAPASTYRAPANTYHPPSNSSSSRPSPTYHAPSNSSGSSNRSSGGKSSGSKSSGGGHPSGGSGHSGGGHPHR
jgi:hypothetical protein